MRCTLTTGRKESWVVTPKALEELERYDESCKRETEMWGYISKQKCQVNFRTDKLHTSISSNDFFPKIPTFWTVSGALKQSEDIKRATARKTRFLTLRKFFDVCTRLSQFLYSPEKRLVINVIVNLDFRCTWMQNIPYSIQLKIVFSFAKFSA